MKYELLKILTYNIAFILLFTTKPIDVNGQSLDELKASLEGQTDTIKLASYIQIVRMHIAENDSLRKYAELGLEESKRQSNIDFQGQFLMFLTISAHNDGSFTKAVKYGREAIARFDLENNALWAAGVSRQIGQIYIDMLQYDSAMHYCLKALEYHSSIEVNPGTMEALGSIAEIHELNGNNHQAIEWLKRKLNLAQENGFIHYISSAHFQLGKVYDQLKNYDSAIYFKKLALQNTSQLKSNNYIDILGSLGQSFYENGHLDSAKFYTQQYYSLARNTEQLYRSDRKKATSALALATILLEEKDLAASKSKFEEALLFSKNISFKRIQYESYKGLYEIAEREKDFEKALSYYLLFSELKNEELDAENQKTIQRLNIEFDTKQKVQEISLLKAEADLKDAEIDQARNTIYWIVALVVLLILFGLLWINRMRLKQREENQKKNFRFLIEGEEKERKRIAQELHDGLGQLLSTARLSVSSLDEEDENAQVKHSLKMIDMAVGETRNISHNLMPNALTSVGLKEALIDLGRKVSKSDMIEIQLDIDNLPKFSEAHAISIYRIVQESLNNIIKYAEAKNVSISAWVDHQIHLEIKDDGKGFDTERIEKSDGIGWQNIKSRLSILGGDYHVYSKLGEGTAVNINLPLDESSKASIG